MTNDEDAIRFRLAQLLLANEQTASTKKQIQVLSALLLTEDQMAELARGNIERHLGDVAADYESEEAAADAIYDEAYTLGFDALVDAGVNQAKARQVAAEVAQTYAQP